MKSSSVFFFFLLFLCFTQLGAQSYENDLKIGLGVTHYPSPNATSLSFYGEFSRPFLPNTFIGISAAAALPVEYIETLEEHKLSSYHFAMNMYFAIFDQKKQNFKIGLGVSAGIFDIDWKVIDTGQIGRDHTFQPGLAILMEYNLIFNKRFILGVTAKGLLYGDAKSVIFGGLHGGFRF